MKYRSSIFMLITLIEALLLLPTTILYASGMLIALIGTFGDKDGINLFFLLIAGLLIVPGYALFSLWWLVLKFRKLTLSQVPFFIYAGLIIGALIALLFISKSTLAPPTPHFTHFVRFINFFVYGGGPLIVSSTVILIIWLQKK